MAHRTVSMLYGKDRMALRVPSRTEVLTGPTIPALQDPESSVRSALQHPINSTPLATIAKEKAPKSVVITMSDITRPVPNKLIITAILEELNRSGIPDEACTILIATGMHRPSTENERIIMLGEELLGRCRVVDHEANKQESLVKISDDPPISINRLYAEADLKIVTGLIEPHFMAGYSGGRKGICPGLVDLNTVQRFHGFQTMAAPTAMEGILTDNPCHEIAVSVAMKMGCDFLVNAAITNEREPAGIFAGDLIRAHEQGCEQVGKWTSARVDKPFDLVLQSAGGYPLDESFYQTVKGMVTALPALHADSTLLICSACTEVGSPDYTDLMLRLGGDYQSFLNEIASNQVTAKDQWQYQMQTRVLTRIGVDRLRMANDGLPLDTQRKLAVSPLEGPGEAMQRAQHFIDEFATSHPNASIAAIPEGPYTMLAGKTSSR
jgi:lactate racemase